MPMLTTFLSGLPVWPRKRPPRTSSAKADMPSSTACTAGTTSSPSTSIRSPAGARSATWRTARCSVVLIFSPRNIASILALRPRSSASAKRRRSVSSVTRCFE